MRGDLELEKMKYMRHAGDLKYAGRVRAVGAKRWPKIGGKPWWKIWQESEHGRTTFFS